MSNPWKIVSFVLVAMLLIAVIESAVMLHKNNLYYKENEKSIQAAFDKRESELDSGLRYQITWRKGLQHTIDSLSTRTRTLDSVGAATIRELSTIKTKYKNLNSSQLAQEMLKQSGQ